MILERQLAPSTHQLPSLSKRSGLIQKASHQ